MCSSDLICIPYIESKLTKSLVEYFVPTSKISIIVNINQARHCLEKNLNVMDYTSKTKNITANVMSDFSQMLKRTARKKERTEDRLAEFEIELQKLTDKYIAELDKIAVDKEKDLMEL